MACTQTKFTGKESTLEYAFGCGDTLPLEADWKFVGAIRGMEKSVEWDTVDGTADDTAGAVRENLATYKAITVSADGVSVIDDGDKYNQQLLADHVFDPVGGQPNVWVRYTRRDRTFVGYMMVSSWTESDPYDDVSTYSFEASSAPAAIAPTSSPTPQV